MKLSAISFSKNYSAKKHVLILSTLLVITFTSFILTIICTTGSTSNYIPLTNIYLGDANIAHINVTKVIPQLGPILTILGTALTAPNRNMSNIFDALKTIADTPALTPLMHLLANAENTSMSLISLTELAPLAISGNPSTDTKELSDIAGLLKLSNNQSITLGGLKNMVQPMLANYNPDDNTTLVTLNLLQDSNNPADTVKSLYALNNLSLSEKLSLTPVFTLFHLTNNISELVSALGTVMVTGKDIPSAKSQTLLTTLQQLLSAQNANVTAVFNTVSSLAANDNERASINAIKTMVQDSTNVNSTLTILNSLISNNITQSESAGISLTALSSILNEVSNKAVAVSTITQLAAIMNNTVTNTQLLALSSMLNATSHDEDTLTILASLQTGLNPNSTTFKYIPSLFNLLSASSNPPQSFSSLVTITSWAQQDPLTFLPIMSILHDAQTVEQVSQEKLMGMTPALLEYLHIPVNYRLSIFTLCTANLENEIISCSDSHAVQNLDFRNIIYNALVQSDFAPYIAALSITANDLYLEGKLLKREHEYVPSVRAVLAMNILAIVTGFILMVNLGLLFWLKWSSKGYAWTIVICLAMATNLFTGLSATILAVVIEVIKSGTKDDKYGVVFKTGLNYAAMIWTAFALLIITSTVLLFVGWTVRHLILPSRFANSDVEKSASDSDNINATKAPLDSNNGKIIQNLTNDSSSLSSNSQNNEKNNDEHDIQLVPSDSQTEPVVNA